MDYNTNLLIELDDLGDDVWSEISELAIKLLEQGKFDSNVAKCCLEAYVMTLNLRMGPTQSDNTH